MIVSYSYLSCSGSILPRSGKRELICLLLFTCNYVVSVRRFPNPPGAYDGLHFLLWHSLSLPHRCVYLVDKMLYKMYLKTANLHLIGFQFTETRGVK